MKNNTRIAFSLAALSTASLFALEAGATIAAAEDGGDASFTADEIVVTARRREERLLDVPGAVTAISASALDAIGVSEIGDIQSSVPNLVLHEGDARTRLLISVVWANWTVWPLPIPVLVFM